MQISLTRLLNEIKMAEKRVRSHYNDSFIAVYHNGNIDEDRATKEIKANWSSVTDLLKRRALLKRKLIEANSTTNVTIAGEVMTIAEAIDRKNSAKLTQDLLINLKARYNSAEDTYVQTNRSVESKIEGMVEALLGREAKTEKADIEAVTAPYREKNAARKIDPLNLRDKIITMERSLEEFLNEVDFVLSEVNASTLVEV